MVYGRWRTVEEFRLVIGIYLHPGMPPHHVRIGRGKKLTKPVLLTSALGNLSSSACIWIEAKYKAKQDARYTKQEGATNSTIKQIIGVSQDQKLEEPAHQIQRAESTDTGSHLGLVVTNGGKAPVSSNGEGKR